MQHDQSQSQQHEGWTPLKDARNAAALAVWLHIPRACRPFLRVRFDIVTLAYRPASGYSPCRSDGLLAGGGPSPILMFWACIS